MLEELYTIQSIILKEMPEEGEPLRKALDLLDDMINELQCDYEFRS
jgi:hypothetical protein